MSTMTTEEGIELAEQVESKKKEEILNIRRNMEKKLIQKYDRTEIDVSKECWYLLEASWLNEWSNFVHGETDPPGVISSKALIDKEKKPLKGLRSRIDSRGVTPLVFYM